MVLRLFLGRLLVSGALFAGLVSAAEAQSVVPWVGTSDGQGGSSCSGPLAGMEFASLAEAEAYTAGLSCVGGAAQQFCGPAEWFPNAWVVREVGGNWVYLMVYEWRVNSDCTGNQATTSYTVRRPVAECPNWEDCEPTPCAEFAGMEIGRFYAGSETQAAVCANPPGGEENECAAEVIGSAFCNDGLCYATLAFSGQACGAEPPVGEDDQLSAPPPNNNCITSGGLSICYQKWDSNCGLVNGEPWCASSMPSNGCVATESGAVVCTADAWSAPTEPDGETPAEPDGEFVAGTEGGGTAYEYYRRETVAASGTPVSAGGPGPGGTGSEGPGEDDFEGELGELATFDEQYLDAEGALASAWNAIVSSETVQAWMALGDGLTASEDCPMPEFTLWDETYVIESHCDLAEEVRAELDLVFGFAWALMALVIVGKA